MISEQQQEQASLYVIGALTASEHLTFEQELLDNPELLELTRSLQRATGLLAQTSPAVALPSGLKDKVFQRIEQMENAKPTNPAVLGLAGLRFAHANDQSGWKPLPIPGAWIKLLSLEKERGYAVLMGKLEAGARYLAHVNAGPEDFLIITGDLHIGSRRTPELLLECPGDLGALVGRHGQDLLF